MISKPKGHRGSWFALWHGQRLPCVHKFWWKPCGIYHESYPKNISESLLAKKREVAEEIRRTGRAILTEDEVILNGEHPVSFRRKGYVGVFSASIILETSEELILKFEDRLG